MAQEAGGLPYGSSNPSGIGAVYFDKAPDLLTTHYQNLKMFDDGMARRRKENQDKQALTAEMFKGLKLDQPGILDTDTPYFQERIQKMNNFLTEGMKAGYDPTKPGAGAFYNTYKSMFDQLQLDMKTSAKQREQIVAANKAAIEKGGDLKETANRSYAYAALPFEQRNKNIDWTKIYTAKPNSFMALVNEEAPKVKLDEVSSMSDFGTQTGTTKTSGKSDSDVADITKGWISKDPDALEADWNKAGQTAQNFYSAQLNEIQQGKDTPLKRVVQDMTPQEYFAYKQVRTRIPSNNTAIDNLKYKPYYEEKEKGRAKSETEYEGAGALWDLVRGVAQDNLPIFDNYDVATGQILADPNAPDELIATQFEPIRVSTYKNPYGETQQENIIAVKKIKNDKNNVYVKTDKIISDPADPTKTITASDWKKLDLNTFANKVFANNYKAKDGNDDAVQGLEALKYFAKKSGNYKNGTVDFSTPISAGGTLGQPLKVVGQRGTGTFDVGEQGQRTPKAATRTTPTKSKELKATEITQTVIDNIKDGEIVIVDGVERVKQNGVLKKVKR